MSKGCNLSLMQNSQYNSLLLILQVIPPFKTNRYANRANCYFTEDFTPTTG